MHILGCPSIILHYTIAVVQKPVIKKPAHTVIFPGSRQERFVIALCFSFPWKDRFRRTQKSGSLFCWRGSLKSLWPPETGRTEEHRATLYPSRCLRGEALKNQNKFHYPDSRLFYNAQSFLAQKQATVLPHLYFQVSKMGTKWRRA